MEEEQYMTLEQKMTLKAILEGDYKIERIAFKSFNQSPDVRVYLDHKPPVNIQPNGKITRLESVEVEL